MFDWLKNKAPAAVSEKPRIGSSIFSTNAAPAKRHLMTGAALLKAAYERTFQVTDSDIVLKNADGAVMAMDSIGDVTSIKQGFGRGFRDVLPEAQLCWYASQGYIGPQLCAMISQQWLVNKICTVPANDAVRTGFTVSVDDGQKVQPDAISELTKMDRQFKLRQNLVEYEQFKRVFGIRIMLFIVDGIDYELPFNIDGVRPGSYRGMCQIDPFWITPELDYQSVSDPLSMDFYEPTWWMVNGKRIHKSHLVIARGPAVPDTLKPTYQFAGLSVPQQLYERVYAAERTANEAPMLAMTKRLNVRKVDIAAAFADQENFEAITEWQTRQRDNHGCLFVGETDEVTQLETALADFDMLIMTQYQLCAAIGNVPATKLLGTTPKGFNSTGDYEEASYHEELESIQEHDLTPVIDRHHLLCIKSVIAPKYNGGVMFNTTVTWKPTDSMTAKELAELNKLKADTHSTLSTAGAIDGIDIREALINDPDSGYVSLGERDAEEIEEEEIIDEEVETLDACDFDAVSYLLGGATLITNQTYLDEWRVDEKVKAADYRVQVSPIFEVSGKKYRIIIDGHHSLAAAIKQGQTPFFVEGEYAGSDYRDAITKGRAFDMAAV